MTHHCVPLRVKAARRRTILTQREVANIIGGLSSGQISRMENGCRRPHPRFIVGAIILFDCPVEDLFHRLYEEVEDHVAREVFKVWEKLDGATTPIEIRRRDFLAGVLSAIAERHNEPRV